MARYPDLELPPKAWHHNLTKEQAVTHDHLKKRIALLNEAELIHNENQSGYYGITDLGLRYTEGELSTDYMEQLDPRPDPEEEDEEDEEEDAATAE